MNYRPATQADASLLAALNQQLIRDEGHRNRMSLAELEERMSDWLNGDYRAVLFEHESAVIGYCLYRIEPESLYLRQFFIGRDYRRRGLGRTAMSWLMSQEWKDVARIRLDVLVENPAAIAFWLSSGFQTYCLTMEWERSRVV
jgi:ribosomal protein S18 acetylase RimI-like enzyme